jgi:hypothetical protein
MANLRQNTANGWAPLCVNEQVFKVETPLHESPVGMPGRRKSLDLQPR